MTRKTNRRTFVGSTLIGGLALGAGQTALATGKQDSDPGERPLVTQSGSEQFQSVLPVADGQDGPTGPLKTQFSTSIDTDGTQITVDDAGGVLVLAPASGSETGTLERYRIEDGEFVQDWAIDGVEFVHDLFDGRVLLERTTSSTRRYLLLDVDTGEQFDVDEALGGYPAGTRVKRHGDTVYIFTIPDQTLAAYETANGNKRWEIDTDHRLGGTVVIEDVLLAAIDEDGVAAYDVGTGQRQWRYAPGGNRPRGPVTDGESVYFLQNDTTLFAVSPDGTREWTLEIPGDVGQRYNQLVYEDGRLLLTTDSENEEGPGGIVPALLSAVDAETGELLWTQHGETDVQDIDVFASLGETIIAGLPKGRSPKPATAQLIDATDGTVRREIPKPDLVTETTAYCADRRSGPYDPTIVGFDLESGTKTTQGYFSERPLDLTVRDGTLSALVGSERSSSKKIRQLTEDDRTFLDVPSDYWAFEPIESLAADGVISGYGDGTFRPEKTVTRAEMAALLVEAFDLEGSPDPEIEFDDIEGHWGQAQIRLAADAGLLSGYPDGTFRPEDPIARQEVLAICATTLDIEAVNVESLLSQYDDTPSDWAREAVAECIAAGVLENDFVRMPPGADLHPLGYATRAMVANFLWNLLNAEEFENPSAT